MTMNPLGFALVLSGSPSLGYSGTAQSFSGHQLPKVHHNLIQPSELFPCRPPTFTLQPIKRALIDHRYGLCRQEELCSSTVVGMCTIELDRHGSQHSFRIFGFDKRFPARPRRRATPPQGAIWRRSLSSVHMSCQTACPGVTSCRRAVWCVI